MWIWYLDQILKGDTTAICARAKQLGLSGLIVKAWDGGDYWLQFNKIIAAAHKAGLLVAAWGYSYGKEIPGEIRAMERALSAGADWFVIDAEVEYEAAGGRQRAGQLLDAVSVSKVSDATFGYSSFGIPELHPGFPWDVFSHRCHVAMPQIYWGEFGMAPDMALQESINQFSKFGLPAAPVGQAYGSVAPAEITAFGKAAWKIGCPGQSFWSWQHATAAMLTAIKNI